MIVNKETILLEIKKKKIKKILQKIMKVFKETILLKKKKKKIDKTPSLLCFSFSLISIISY